MCPSFAIILYTKELGYWTLHHSNTRFKYSTIPICLFFLKGLSTIQYYSCQAFYDKVTALKVGTSASQPKIFTIAPSNVHYFIISVIHLGLSIVSVSIFFQC